MMLSRYTLATTKDIVSFEVVKYIWKVQEELNIRASFVAHGVVRVLWRRSCLESPYHIWIQIKVKITNYLCPLKPCVELYYSLLCNISIARGQKEALWLSSCGSRLFCDSGIHIVIYAYSYSFMHIPTCASHLHVKELNIWKCIALNTMCVPTKCEGIMK